MALEVVKNIDIDFYDKKYILINAKQLDNKSRQLLVTCYNQGTIIPINEGEHAAYIRYEKSDDYGVFNECKIKGIGKVLVEFTEQMLASDGICYADLLIVNKGDAEVDSETCEIVIKNDACVLSSMTFCIDVSEIPVANSEIESSYEYNAFNQSLADYWKRFEDVMKTSKSWAVGKTGIRDGENTNNSEYWSEQSKTSANNAKTSETKAKTSEVNAKTSETNASTSEANAKTSEGNALNSEQNAKVSEDAAKISEINAKTSETNAKTSETNADISEVNARTSETNALTSEQNAKTSETNALNSANRAQSYTVGGTGTREGEDTNNAQWYYNEIKDILNGLNIVFVPKGTISFSELATVKETAIPGYIYNIKDDFTTDDSFREGGGVTYTAGTNVYYVIDENEEYKWDCFGGAASPVAAVEDVKDYLGINEEIEIG